MRDPLERFAEKVDFSGDCWEWTAVRHRKGYGQFRADGSMRQAHRWLWEQVVAPVPDGLELDHLCKNRACVNPDHLEPVTHQVNIDRAARKTEAQRAAWARRRKTHCSQGHEFTEENTLRYSYGRYCRTCNAARARAWNAAKRAA